MCEPNHSICQIFNPAEEQNRNALLFGQALNIAWKKDIGVFTHISKMGAGHHETANTHGLSAWLDNFTGYEVSWWDRKCKLDGYINCPPEFKEESLLAAHQYADMVSIGSLHSLRQFLEVSLQKTTRPLMYTYNFEFILNEKGRNNFYSKYRQLLKLVNQRYIRFKGIKEVLSFTDRKTITKILLGYTRKREFLVPEWADDDKLWVKK